MIFYHLPNFITPRICFFDKEVRSEAYCNLDAVRYFIVATSVFLYDFIKLCVFLYCCCLLYSRQAVNFFVEIKFFRGARKCRYFIVATSVFLYDFIKLCVFLYNFGIYIPLFIKVKDIAVFKKQILGVMKFGR